MTTLSYFLSPVKVILADISFRGKIIEAVKKKIGYLIKVVRRSDERKEGFKPVHKRWIIAHICLV